MCIAGVFGAGETRSLAVLLIALSIELEDFSAVVFTKENVVAKALADHFFSVQRLLASARSLNTFDCMLQHKLIGLIDALT